MLLNFGQLLFLINKIDNTESLFCDWKFLKYVCILFKAENERSELTPVARIVKIKDDNSVIFG